MAKIKTPVKPRIGVVKPKVFIGSAYEALNVAEEIRSLLANDADPTVWNTAREFQANDSALDGLLTLIERNDYALFVLSLEDHLKIRADLTLAVRDNVLFEFGLFMGQLGKDRVAAILEVTGPGAPDTRVPSDLQGITIHRFTRSANPGTLRNSVAIALKPFLDTIREKKRRKRKILLMESWGFDPGSRTFSVSLDPVRLHENIPKLRGCEFLLVAFVEGSQCPYEDETRIAVGPRRKFSETDRRGIEMSVELGPEVEFERGDKICCHLILVPPDADPTGAETIAEMIAAGCDVIDSVGHTVESLPRKKSGKRSAPGKTKKKAGSSLPSHKAATKQAAARSKSAKSKKKSRSTKR
jgi:hypothetical protein